LFSIIEAAGWPIWPLLICSVVATALILERFYQLRKPLIAPVGLLENVLMKLETQGPHAFNTQALRSHSALGAVLSATLVAFCESPNADEQNLRAEIEDRGRAIARELEKHQSTLSTIASAAPLLGLFGTVVGMIDIFGSQSGLNSNPVQLAHGISTALYNTAFGLLIAIPTLICWRYFRNKIDDFVLVLESSGSMLLKALLKTQHSL
jgi:biopolymer transport protein ExbB